MEINAVYGPSMQSTEEFWYYDGDDAVITMQEIGQFLISKGAHRMQLSGKMGFKKTTDAID